MAKDSFEISNVANSASGSQEAHNNLLSDAMDHVKNTWTNVTQGDASGGQYLEAGAELVGGAALAIGAARGGGKIVSLLKSEPSLDLTMGKTHLGRVLPDLTDAQTTKLAKDLKLFPAQGKEIDPADANRAIGTLVNSAPELMAGKAVNELRSVEGAYVDLGQNGKALETIDLAIRNSRGLPNMLTLGLLPKAERLEPLFYLDKSEILLELGQTAKANQALNKFAHGYAVERLAQKFPFLSEGAASKIAKSELPNYDASILDSGNKIFDAVDSVVKKIDLPGRGRPF